MGKVDFGGLATQAGGGIIGAAMGLALEKHNDKRQLKQEGKLMEMQGEQARKMALFNHEQQMKMWENTNYSAQMEQLRKAGLNPGLLYGMGGGGGQTAAAAPASPGHGGAPKGGGEAMGMGIMGAQAALMLAQTEKIKAETTNLKETTPVIGKQGKNIDADTENKILNSVILQYTGKDIKDTYEQVKSPNRGIEADTYQKELESRGGIAHNIYELWRDGKLAEKSNAEIESILVANAKSRTERQAIEKQMDLIEENIKGAKIANVIADLEMRLQNETGIDKASPAWMKVLGRLFVNLMNR